MYYPDVTQVMIADGVPVHSTLPKEGGIIDFGDMVDSWLAAEPAESPEAALGAILARHGGGPLRIVICGSLYLAGAVLTSHG